MQHGHVCHAPQAQVLLLLLLLLLLCGSSAACVATGSGVGTHKWVLCTKRRTARSSGVCCLLNCRSNSTSNTEATCV
jgi:hypothetical protein